MSLRNAASDTAVPLADALAHADLEVAGPLGLEPGIAAEAVAVGRVRRAEAAAGEAVDRRARVSA